MSTHKHIDLICVVVLLLTLLLTILFMCGERLGIEVIVDEDAEAYSGNTYFTDNDRRADWDSSSATYITLKGSGAAVSGGGAYAYDGTVIITNAGHYVLSGTLDDGSVIVDTDNRAKVWLLLDGAAISCSDDACLRIEQADKVFLTLAEGSENTMSSGESYTQTALDDGTDGVIFAHDDLTINGSGSLTVTALYRHGISANDDLVITGGNISITAPADALRANEALRICEATITLDAGDDGVTVNHADGYLYIESGTLDIVSKDDGVHSEGDVLIQGGRLTINAGDDGIHAGTLFSIAGGSIDISDCYEGIEAVRIDMAGGEISIHAADDGLNANGNSMAGFGPGAQSGSESEETWIHISGGTLTVLNDTAVDADGLDSNGDIVISGGSVRVSLTNGGTNSALDCGSESGGVCTISGGDVVACGSYAMAEGFDESSAQCSILYNLSAGAEAGTDISLIDSAGNLLLSYTAPNSFSSVLLSSPALRTGETYRVMIGDQTEEITLTESAASYGDAASSQFGGRMNWGGMARREDNQSADGENVPTPPAIPASDASDAHSGPPAFSEGMTPPERPASDGENFTPPDGESVAPPENGALDGERPAFSGHPEMTEMGGEESATAQEPTAVSGETWALLGISALALVLGLLLAIVYKPE